MSGTISALLARTRDALFEGDRAGQELRHHALFVAAKCDHARAIHLAIEKGPIFAPAFQIAAQILVALHGQNSLCIAAHRELAEEGGDLKNEESERRLVV